MDSLVLELQRDAMGSETKVSDLLRKALIVARKLAIPKFQEWISLELDGYKDGRNIPDYRTVHGEIRVFNPYRGWVNLIMQDMDTDVVEYLTSPPVAQSIGELENIISNRNDKSILTICFSPETENRLMRGMRYPLRPVLHISESAIHGIIETVRNTILNWTLKLEEDGILGNGMTFTQEERNRAEKSSNITIQNFQGILGDVQHSSVSQDMMMNINKGDFDSLSNHLTSIGLSETDISELRTAINKQQSPKDSKDFGPKISEWIGKMVAKAASGSWAIAVGTAANLLTQAINAYYGFH